jgi:hypothetical protein
MKTLKNLMIGMFILTMTSCFVGKLVDYSTISIEQSKTYDKSKNELYIAANSWMAEVFTSSKSVIQFTDKDAGVIKGRYSLFYTAPYSSYSMLTGHNYTFPEVSHTALITLLCKDNEVKIIIKGEGTGSVFYTKDTGEQTYGYSDVQAKTDIDKLIKSFFTYVDNYKSF